jgi:hypothetical protein
MIVNDLENSSAQPSGANDGSGLNEIVIDVPFRLPSRTRSLGAATLP